MKRGEKGPTITKSSVYCKPFVEVAHSKGAALRITVAVTTVAAPPSPVAMASGSSRPWPLPLPLTQGDSIDVLSSVESLISNLIISDHNFYLVVKGQL